MSKKRGGRKFFQNQINVEVIIRHVHSWDFFAGLLPEMEVCGSLRFLVLAGCTWGKKFFFAVIDFMLAFSLF